ncbi:MAG: hypothetical protein KAS32_23315 [Candidatus Peribacteraceae bacterium]|nr:hypothetical protein [Candidatus Peribacteraceae bacterium]
MTVNIYNILFPLFPSDRNHYVYRITQIEPKEKFGRYYIGVRTCDCSIENDEYMGSGIISSPTIEKYGVDCFKKDILYIGTDRKAALNCEGELVTKETIKDPLCMNLVCGGAGGEYKRIETMFIPGDDGMTVYQRAALKANKTRSIVGDDGMTINQRSVKKGLETKYIIGDDGMTTHQRVDKKRRAVMLKIGDDGLNGYQRSLSKRHHTKLKIGFDGMNVYQQATEKTKNTISKGLFMTPNGAFLSANTAGGPNHIRGETVKKRCIIKCDTVIKLSGFYNIKDYTKEEAIGKTWRELGWYFIPK